MSDDNASNPPSAIRHPQSLPDRGHLLTEQRLPTSAGLDALSIEDALRVINEQDATIPSIIAQAIPQIGKLVHTIVNAMRGGGRLIYLGAGTSGRLGVLDASEVPPTFHCDPGNVVGLIAGGDTALRNSSEGKEDDPHGSSAELDALHVGASDVVVGIAAGGTTPYVLGGLHHARQLGAATALVCCVTQEQLHPSPRGEGTSPNDAAAPARALPGGAPGGAPNAAMSSLVRNYIASIEQLISLPVGAEVVTGSTRMKAGTATKLVLNMISTTVMVQLGKVWGNLMVDMKASNVKLRDRAVRFIVGQTNLSRVEAAKLLDGAGGRVKLALVMAIKGVDAAVAEKLLEEQHQQLRPILGEPR
ncbi:MAG: N-acetylmuramic acid 6-phosphate etherase [Phycisphaeraceae bacterium]